jgi:hypothetical protein
MAYVEPEVAAETGTATEAKASEHRLAVDIRGRAELARMTPLPFYHRIHDRPR